MKPSVFRALVLAAVAASSAAVFASPKANGTLETFRNGDGGWVGRIGPNGTGVTWIEEDFGKPRPSLRTKYSDFLKNGLRWYNEGNGFTGDYALVPSFTFGVDVNTLSLIEGQEVTTRDLMVWFLDFQHPPAGYDSISVGVKIGTLTTGAGWQRWSVTIPDTDALELPEGWVGTGATDPVTGEPTLPAGRSFSEVMHHVDQIAIQTLRQPNVLVLDSFDVAIDNIYVVANCPGTHAHPAAAMDLATKVGSPFRKC